MTAVSRSLETVNQHIVELRWQDVEGKRIREVAILVFEGRLITSLREYWSFEQVAGLSPTPD